MIVICKNPIKETLTPIPNGINLLFYTSCTYKPGTVTIWINGIKLITDWEDGFIETGSTEITMKEVPLSGDSLQAEYEPL